MATYAVHDGETVVNVILADSADIAEQATGLTAVEVAEDGSPGIGWFLEGGDWVAPEVEPEQIEDPSGASEEIVDGEPEEV